MSPIIAALAFALTVPVTQPIDQAQVSALSSSAVTPSPPIDRGAFHDAMRKLWEDHVTWTRLSIVSAAAGLPDAQPTAERLLRNQVDIGDWPRKTLRAEMRHHLDLTLQQAQARLRSDWAADIAAYDTVHQHILGMADVLSKGIVSQFPRRFK